MKSKISLSLLFCVLASIITKAQVQYIPYAAHRYAVTLGGGPTILFGDLSKPKIKAAARLNFDYNFTPFVSAGIEGQIGGLAATGGTGLKGLSVKNSYTAANINVRVGIGQFMDRKKLTDAKKILGGIYGGIGAGFVQSNITEIDNYFFNGKEIYGNKLDEMEFVIPLNAGWNIELPKMGKVSDLVANINLQYNLVQGEYIDGYNFPSSHNKRNDGYAFISLALRYNFGKFR